MENNILDNEQLDKITGAGDVDSLKFKGKDVPLPKSDNKKKEYDIADGDYTACTYYKNFVEKKLVCTYKDLCRNEICPERKR